MDPGTTVKWVDYEKFDKASNRYMLRGQPLPESIDTHTINDSIHEYVIFRNGATFLGPYISDIGAVPIFSGIRWASYFAQQSGLLITPFDSGLEGMAAEDIELSDGFRIEKISLLDLLKKVQDDHGPFVDIGLNPLSQRFRQGWFFKYGDAWMLQTISGVWEINQNSLKRRDDVIPFKGHLGMESTSDGVLPNVSSIVAAPFKRIIGSDHSPVSEDDATEIIDGEFGKDKDVLSDGLHAGSLPSSDEFVIAAFDKITGESFAEAIYGDSDVTLGFLVFPDVLAAANFLIKDIIPHDQEIRLSGFHLSHGGGQRGSNDSERDERVTQGIVTAIRRTCHDALVHGYRPEHASHIRRLMHDATVTFEVTEIGYFGDLLFFGTSDGGEVWDRVDSDLSDSGDIVAKLKGVKESIQVRSRPISEVESRLRRSLGSAYDLLSQDSHVIASSLIDKYDRIGNRSGYDYAGITMKVSKLIERELNVRIFRPWRESTRQGIGKEGLREWRSALESKTLNRTDTALMEWLENGRKLDLGAIRFALQELGDIDSDSQVKEQLLEYIQRLNGESWLLSQELFDLLQDISTKYRNGGVHEHVVSYAVCKEAIERVVLGPEPMLQILMVSTQPRTSLNQDADATV